MEQDDLPGLKKALRSIDRDEMKRVLGGLEKSETSKRRFRLYKRLAVAAGILLMVAATWGLLKQSAQATPQALFAAHFEPMENVIYPITRDLIPDQDTPNEKLAYQAYELGEYKSAIQLFNQIDDSQKTLDQAFYKSLAQLALGQNKSAIEVLVQLANDEQYSFQQNAQWYLALAYLNEESISKSRTILNIIVNTANHPYQASAEQLLSNI